MTQNRFYTIDSHCHIYDSVYDKDLDEVISRAKENDILKLVVIATNIKSIKKCIKLKDRYGSFVIIGAAFHPTELNDITEKDKSLLECMCRENTINLVGETGLDYYWNKDTKDIQQEFFNWHLDLACKYNLPFCIHCREAYSDTYDILSNKLNNKNKINGIIHSFSGSWEIAQKFLDLNLYLSISGVVTFKNAKKVKEVVKNCPLNKILVETDSPYLTPHAYRGKRNEPSYIRYIIEEISLLKCLDIKIIKQQILRNTLSVLNIKNL